MPDTVPAGRVSQQDQELAQAKHEGRLMVEHFQALTGGGHPGGTRRATHGRMVVPGARMTTRLLVGFAGCALLFAGYAILSTRRWLDREHRAYYATADSTYPG
jgi:hypothetical protein